MLCRCLDIPFHLLDHRLTDREWADEWRHLDHVLNCIVDMVEKTRRTVSVLRRCQESDHEELNYWRRRSSEHEDPRKARGAAPALLQDPQSPHRHTHLRLSEGLCVAARPWLRARRDERTL